MFLVYAETLSLSLQLVLLCALSLARHSASALAQTVGRQTSASSDPFSSNLTIMEGSELDLATAEQVIMRWDPSSSTASPDLSSVLFSPGGDRAEAERYLSAVDSLRRSMKDSPRGASSPRQLSMNPLQCAMARLEDEFRHILVSRSIEIEIESLVDLNSLSMSSDGGSSSPHRSRRNNSRLQSMCAMRELDLLPPDAIEDLRNIASRMVNNGYGRECVQVYGSARKPAVDQSLKRLGIEKLSIGDVQRLDWEIVETKIRRWIKSSRIAIRVIFASERNLCKMIFDEEGLEDAPFSEAVKGSALQLLGFAEAIAIGRRSPEKLFKILDLHDSLSDLLFDISVIFGSKSTESIHLQAEEIVSRLADAVRGILSEFENAVLKDPSKTAVPGGTIHPLTRYVMNYISLISDYKTTLSKLITNIPSYRLSATEETIIEDFDFPESENETPLAAHLIWIMFILHHNIEIKSGLYKDTALAHFFIMNNLHYIVHKVKDSPELNQIIGDSYLRKLTRVFGQAAANYQRVTWLKILHNLRDEGLHVTGGFTSGISKSTLRERFKAFNASFEEAHRIQSLWLIPDSQLKEELRISIAEKLLPAYRSFLGRFRQHIENGKHPELYIKYSVEDLEVAVLDFFEGVQAPLLNRRRSH